MKINKKQIISALVLSFAFMAFSALSTPVQAAGTWNSQIGINEIGVKYDQTSQNPTSVTTIAVRIINYSLSILGILFLALFIFSGYQWMTAGGNEDDIKKAKSRMVNAIIGVVIVLASWAITWFVFDKLVLPSTTGDSSYSTNYDITH